MTGPLSLFDVVRIPLGLPADGVRPGARAVILDIYETPSPAYEVEVLDEDGNTVFTGAVDPSCVVLEQHFLNEDG